MLSVQPPKTTAAAAGPATGAEGTAREAAAARTGAASALSTRVLAPRYAVLWAAFFNFIAFLFFGLHVAETVGSGIVSTAIVDDRVIFGSDWPHIEGMPKPLDYVVEVKHFDDAAQQRIMRDNARELNMRRLA